jgi:hypothetical protein
MKWAKLIESQQNFTSAVVAINSFTSSPIPASEGNPAIPARKFVNIKTNPNFGTLVPSIPKA